jgi:chloramphenicol 3-O-phosphotransferase
MKRFLALTGAALALVGVLATAGCQAKNRAERANRDGSVSTTQQQQPQAPNSTVQQPVDTGSVDSDLSSVDSLLNDTDGGLTDPSPADAD